MRGELRWVALFGVLSLGYLVLFAPSTPASEDQRQVLVVQTARQTPHVAPAVVKNSIPPPPPTTFVELPACSSWTRIVAEMFAPLAREERGRRNASVSTGGISRTRTIQGLPDGRGISLVQWLGPGILAEALLSKRRRAYHHVRWVAPVPAVFEVPIVSAVAANRRPSYRQTAQMRDIFFSLGNRSRAPLAPRIAPSVDFAAPYMLKIPEAYVRMPPRGQEAPCVFDAEGRLYLADRADCGTVAGSGVKGNTNDPTSCPTSSRELSKFVKEGEREDSALQFPIAVVRQNWGRAYFHEFIESMGRVTPFLSYIIRERVRLLIPPGSVVVREMCALVPGLLCFQELPGRVFYAPHVFVPSTTPCAGGGPQTLALRDLMHTHLVPPSPPSDQQRSILLIERLRNRRALRNHREVLAALRQRFSDRLDVVVHTGGEAWIEQQRMFARALVVVGPHGAGMSNIVSCRPDAALVEVHMKDPNLCYLCAALALCMRYAAVHPAAFTHEGMVADVPALLDAIERVLNSPPPACSAPTFVDDPPVLPRDAHFSRN